MPTGLPTLNDAAIAVIGLGYVGLPLAIAFGKRRKTVGFDIDSQRIEELRRGRDRTLETSAPELAEARYLTFSSDAAQLTAANVFIVTVPTPIDAFKRPDLRPIEAASRTVGAAMKPGSVVVYESTVYPGTTEEICVPLLEQASGLKHNADFYTGYSPERINPGDRQHRLESIIKITAGSTPEAAEFVDTLYREIVAAGTHRASSIRVAEMAKVIENTQRDLNIALVNEVALICQRLGIDSHEVLDAAGTKWNFLPFRPGLVGGHCIGVDPYYLTHKAQQLGYHPEVILSGRRINDSMGAHVAQRVIRLMLQRRIHLVGARVLVLGLAFKENCPDLRNTRVVDVVREFHGYEAQVDVFDPWVDAAAARHEYGIDMTEQLDENRYDAVILAVAHRQFAEMGAARIRALAKPGGVLFDVKHVLPKKEVDDCL
jgi:UDP-N-acetyl-D-glucosamine/UDP-N-acetyl-D-galactosamine dehydrogenase